MEQMVLVLGKHHTCVLIVYYCKIKIANFNSIKINIIQLEIKKWFKIYCKIFERRILCSTCVLSKQKVYKTDIDCLHSTCVKDFSTSGCTAIENCKHYQHIDKNHPNENVNTLKTH